MLLDRRDQLEAGERLLEAGLVERLDGMEAHDLGRDAALLELVRRLDRLGQHVAGREQADVVAVGNADRLADLEIGEGAGCTTGSPFLPMRI